MPNNLQTSFIIRPPLLFLDPTKPIRSTESVENLFNQDFGDGFCFFVTGRKCFGPLRERIHTGKYVDVSSF